MMKLRPLFALGLGLPLVIWTASCVGDDPIAAQADAGGGGSDATAQNDTSVLPGPNDASQGDVLTCTGGLTACGGGCVDTTTSAANCGRCDRACGAGSTCTASKCAPIQLTTALDQPSAIALTTGFVLVHDANMLVRCGKDGCNPATPMWTAAGTTTLAGTLSVDKTYAFVLGTPPSATGTRLLRINLDGTSTTPVNITGSSPINFPNTLASDDREHVVSTPYRNHRCINAIGTCSSMPVLKDAETPIAIALDPTRYVWTMTNSADHVQACARPAADAGTYGDAGDCGNVTGLAPVPDAGPATTAKHIVAAGGVAYWTEVGPAGANSKVLACSLAGCNRNPTVIAASEEVIDGLAADATGVYWTNGLAGTVRVCRNLTTGCGTTAETLATGATNPGPIALDATYVFYAARGSGANTGALLKVAK